MATATTLKPSRREPLHERPLVARRTDALHCARQGRAAVKQAFAETETATSDDQRRGMMPSQAATPPVLQTPELARPCRVHVPDLDAGTPGLTLHGVANLSRAEARQDFGEALAIRPQPCLVGPEVQILEDDRTTSPARSRDHRLRNPPDRVGPGAQRNAHHTGDTTVRRDINHSQMIPVQIHADSAGDRIGNQLGLRLVERDAQLDLAPRQQLHTPRYRGPSGHRRLDQRLLRGLEDNASKYNVLRPGTLRHAQPQPPVRPLRHSVAGGTSALAAEQGHRVAPPAPFGQTAAAQQPAAAETPAGTPAQLPGEPRYRGLDLASRHGVAPTAPRVETVLRPPFFQPRETLPQGRQPVLSALPPRAGRLLRDRTTAGPVARQDTEAGAHRPLDVRRLEPLLVDPAEGSARRASKDRNRGSQYRQILPRRAHDGHERRRHCDETQPKKRLHFTCICMQPEYQERATVAYPSNPTQPISASEAAALRAEHGENVPACMRVCLFRSGWVDVLRLTADDIDLADIAHGLALTNRWNGATAETVSVAWHSLVVSALASEIQPAAALHGLMHDAAEAYTGDWTQPYKLHLGPMLTGIAERVEHACLKAAGVRRPAATIDAVKEADQSVLLLEHASRWDMNQQMRVEDRERVARAHEAAKRINPYDNGAPFTLENKSESAFIDQALWLMPAAAPMRRRLERASATRSAK